jgi:glyoxylase-like metal-dependent hydrolase (beta-lactamase superfamily II)
VLSGAVSIDQGRSYRFRLSDAGATRLLREVRDKQHLELLVNTRHLTQQGDRHEWERAGTFEISPGIHRIPLPLPGDGLKAVNVYAVADGDQVVLIDGGWALADVTEFLDEALQRIGYSLGAVREFLVTHLHRDHYTQAVAVRRVYGTPVSVGMGERVCLDAIRGLTSNPNIERLYRAGALRLSRELADNPIQFDMTYWEEPDRWITERAEILFEARTLQVIATPGHTRGHVVYHDAEHNVLFAGDHVLPHITPSIGVEPVRPPSPLRDYIASLQLIRAMPDAQLLPAHGPVTESAHVRVDELLAHHKARLEDTAVAVDAGAQTGFEVACALDWTRHRRAFNCLDAFNQVLAVNETMAHLDVLVDRGWLVATELDGVLRFTRR